MTGFIWSAAQQHKDGWQILPKQGLLRGFLTAASLLVLLLLLLDLRPLAGRLQSSVAPFSLVRQPEVTLGQDVKVQARRWVALLARQLGHIGGLLPVFLSSAHSDRAALDYCGEVEFPTVELRERTLTPGNGYGSADLLVAHVAAAILPSGGSGWNPKAISSILVWLGLRHGTYGPQAGSGL